MGRHAAYEAGRAETCRRRRSESTTGKQSVQPGRITTAHGDKNTSTVAQQLHQHGQSTATARATTRHGYDTGTDTARHGTARHGTATARHGYGTARHGTARHGTVYGTARATARPRYGRDLTPGSRTKRPHQTLGRRHARTPAAQSCCRASSVRPRFGGHHVGIAGRRVGRPCSPSGITLHRHNRAKRTPACTCVYDTLGGSPAVLNNSNRLPGW